ncbi:MAG: response regulator transcription factor [Oscillospiraceae bacterium]|nr:response regulator transcription factor [Oscillospiraceae bacterium]
MRLLVVEDEKHLNKTLTERLTKIGYTVDSCFDGEDALYYIENTRYDGIILDVMMPKINGFEVLRTMRNNKILTPVLMLTAKDSDEDIINGLDLGANDYLTKPFSFNVLCARLRAMLRLKENVTGAILEVADLSVDTVARVVKRGDTVIELSSKEYSVLEYLMRNKGIIVSKEKIEENIWSYEYEGSSDVIKVYIHHLRKKIDDNFEKKLLHTVKNVGYVIKEG